MRIKKELKKYWIEYLTIILGTLITALAINLFLVPHKISPGGLSGIATILYYLSNGRIPIGAAVLAMNIPLFILGAKLIGKRFAFRTLFSLIFLSFFIDSTQQITQIFVQSNLAQLNSSLAPDLLLYSLFGGSLMGLGLGLVFRSGATTGGSDLGARILNHFFPNFTIAQLLLVIESCIVIFVAISFNSFILALYAIVTLFLQSKVIDAILEGINFAKAVFIISEHADHIAKKIIKDLDRGITGLNGIGMYTGKEKTVLLCVLHREQLSQLKELVHKIDGNAFVILTDVREVLGEGFKTYEQH